METTSQSSSRRHTTSLELDKTIDRIRQLPNFQRFLLPPTASELMAATSPMQSIVLINFDFLRCDAFLIQQHNIRILNLPGVHDLEMCKKIISLTSHSFTKHLLLERLKWLWDVVAGPVLDALRFLEAVTTGEWPRVCWILTGPFSSLPIHAAGYHCTPGSQTVLDRVVSSYSPSIKAPLYASRKAQRSRGRAFDKTVLVSMNTIPGCSGLLFAKAEMIELDILLPASISRETLQEPLKERVMTSLDGCPISHFAGHGKSDRSDPSNSTLLMADWQTNPLTVKDLVSLKLHQNPPLLAYLSACSTGLNLTTNLIDEGIHLMSACQLAGFRHVIGSLWEVSDKHCVDVAKDVYNAMIKAGMSDASVSQGLHNAIRNLRDGPQGGNCTTREARDARLIEVEESQESRIGDPIVWATYIHIGI